MTDNAAPPEVAQPQPQLNQPQQPPTQPPEAPKPAPVPITKTRRLLPPSFNLKYGRQDVTRHVTDHAVAIDAQASLCSLTYQQLQQLSDIDLPLTEAQFTRMWKTIILKRCQDVFEQQKTRRADNYVRLTRNLLLPAPLADLLYALGSYFDPLAGITHHITPPPRGADAPNWWTVDNAILGDWTNLVSDMVPFFTMKEYPSISDVEGRPIVLTSISDTGNMRTVKIYRSGPRPSDVKLRMVNDEIFTAPYPFADCHLAASETLLVSTTREQYISSYCLQDPAY